MAQAPTMLRLFELMRMMAAEAASGLSPEAFDEPRGGSNSPKWITGHLALGMDFGLNLLGQPQASIQDMMPTYGPNSPGGKIGDDGRTQQSLVAHLKESGDKLAAAFQQVTNEHLDQPNPTPFLVEELPTIGDLLGHLMTTHLSLHTGQLSQIRRELGMPSVISIG